MAHQQPARAHFTNTTPSAAKSSLIMQSWKSLFETMEAAVVLVGAIITTVQIALTKLKASPSQDKIKAAFKTFLLLSPALLSFILMD